MQMDEKAGLKRVLEQELQWVQHRMKNLDLIDEKLLQTRQLAVQAKHENLTTEGIEALTARMNDLAAQVRELDRESRRTEEGKIFE